MSRCTLSLGLSCAIAAAIDPNSALAESALRDRRAPGVEVAADGAVAAATFDELARLAADDAGPREIRLRPGVYRGDLVLKRPIIIRGEAETVLEGSGSNTVLVIEANDVTVENLSIRRSGRRSTTEDAGIRASGERIRIADVRVEDTLFGVTLRACRGCTLERLRIEGSGDHSALQGDGIKLWESHDSVVRGCVVENARDVVVWYTRRALVEDNVVRHSRYGTHFMYAHDGIARRNRFEENTVGVFVMYSLRLDIEGNVLAGARGAAGMGIGFKESDSIRVRGNWFVANSTGVYLDFTPRTTDQPVVFEGNVFALDDVALRLHSVERGVIVRGNDFHGNGETLEVDGGGDALGCEVKGNYFGDYEGYDMNGDGTGDVPYRVATLSNELAGRHPALKFFYGTTAMQLVDAIARAIPVFGSRTLMVDDAPLVRAPEVRAP